MRRHRFVIRSSRALAGSGWRGVIVVFNRRSLGALGLAGRRRGSRRPDHRAPRPGLCSESSSRSAAGTSTCRTPASVFAQPTVIVPLARFTSGHRARTPRPPSVRAGHRGRRSAAAARRRRSSEGSFSGSIVGLLGFVHFTRRRSHGSPDRRPPRCSHRSTVRGAQPASERLSYRSPARLTLDLIAERRKVSDVRSCQTLRARRALSRPTNDASRGRPSPQRQGRHRRTPAPPTRWNGEDDVSTETMLGSFCSS